MKKIAFLIFLILFSFFNLSAQPKLTKAEYAVYASVLKVLYKENRETYANKSEFVFLKETKFDPELVLPSAKKYKHLVEEFSRKNKIPGIIEKNFPPGVYSDTYYLVSQAEIDELLEKGRIETERRLAEAKELNPSGGYRDFPVGDWLPFFQKYPESSGLHILSRVGFSGQYAMVQIKANRGWNGFARNYILKRVNGSYRIIISNGTTWR